MVRQKVCFKICCWLYGKLTGCKKCSMCSSHIFHELFGTSGETSSSRTWSHSRELVSDMLCSSWRSVIIRAPKCDLQSLWTILEPLLFLCNALGMCALTKDIFLCICICCFSLRVVVKYATSFFFENERVSG